MAKEQGTKTGSEPARPSGIDNREKIIASISSMPSMSTEARELLRLLQDPKRAPGLTTDSLDEVRLTHTASRLAKWMSSDAGDSLGSLRETILELSMHGIVQGVTAWAGMSLSPRKVRCYDASFEDLMKHALIVRLGVERLANAWHLTVPYFAYTAALLHDIGKLVLGTVSGIDRELIETVAKDKGISLVDAERTVLGADHSEIGAILLHGWNMPECVVETVRCHHSPDVYPGDDLAAQLVHLADVMSGMADGSSRGNRASQVVELCGSAFERIGVKEKAGIRLMASLGQELAQVEALFPCGTATPSVKR